MVDNHFISFMLFVSLFHGFLACFAYGATNITTDEDALLAFKSHIVSDLHLLLTTNWSKATSACNWVGVTCNARHGRVSALDLSSMNLTGTIPPHLGNLSFLRFISLRNNSFHGSLPNELSKLGRMKSIILSYNQFSGEIPSWIGSFTLLERLGLAINMFTGFIPTSLFNLSKLDNLDLGWNSLQGHIPESIKHLRSLTKLYLDSNSLSGPIPSAIFDLALKEIDLSDNELSGPMPTLRNTSSLVIIDFMYNNLTGPLPPNNCAHFPNLEWLYLSANQFVGSIPSGLSACRKLTRLSLSVNHFQGSIDREIWNLTMLQMLYLGPNNFSGTTIPASIGKLVDLQEIGLSSSGLVGPIPSTIGNLTRLKFLDLDENSLTGTIPHEIGNLANLERLYVQMNRLSGFVPSGIYNASSMKTISLIENHLSGHLPSSLGLHLPNLEVFYTSGNNFTGRLPTSLSNASNLHSIGFSENSFFGPIPDELGNLRNLQNLHAEKNHLTTKSLSSGLSILSSLANCKSLRILILGDNPLNGTLPISIANLSVSLELFVVNTCGITGTIPDGIGNLSSLTRLDLRENEVRGSIPATIGNLKNLQGLNLEKNKLTGSLSFTLCDLGSLAYLSLEVNELFGPIPSCWSNVTSLRTLFLGSNKFNSTIPTTLWRLEDILELDLSSNSLTGSLSPDISNLKAAIFIDLSKNQLSDNIPPIFGSLKDLSTFSLANNRLEGFIPSSFSDAINLEFLDLSNNSLSGEIPKSFEKLMHLTHLNVSFNKLQGEIPYEGPFRSLSAESFMGNRGLCGVAKFQVQPCKTSNIKSKPVLRNILLVVGLMSLALITIASIFIIRYRKRNMRLRMIGQPQLSPLAALERISYVELEQATDEFNEINLLGKGSFGSVYKGILPNGMNVAVKVFNLQTEGAFKSFDVECEVIRMIRHRNLVKIITSCSNLDFKALVLRFMPNYSLEKWLYSHNHFLDILQRLNIMIDVASALEYLHHGYTTPIVHCDLKPSNILLDEDMVAHVSDFGIAKLLGEGQYIIQTITLATVGYMAPEYGSEGVVSIRGDMYSFGILLMETFTRKKPTDEMFDEEMNMKQWVKESMPGGIAQVTDANLLRSEDHHVSAKRDCVLSIMKLALECSADLPEERLDIKDVVGTLNKIKVKLLMNINHARQNQRCS